MKRALWWILVGLGAALLAAVWGGVVSFLLAGGLKKVAAFYLAQLLLPPAGIFALVHSGLVAWKAPTARPFAGVVGAWAVVSLTPVLLMLGLWTPAYPASLENTEPAATVRLPLEGPVIVAWGGDTVAENYHAATPDQRWAYDLLVEPATHGSADLESYGCYGLDVLAPAAGTVAIAHDGEPDQDPSTFVPNPTAPAGNHVAIELETGTHLLLAHLIPGSLTVTEGDAVVEGQVLGKCGNSGNTSEPHVHIHHVKQRPEMIGFGEGLPLFFRDHDGDPMPTGGIEMDGDDVRLIGDRVQHIGPG
ncbi:MAG: M23 family metallopeptidase [Proteobacteria bacterium]|nr:M23 family metallopeptidase [Pseudomonadota bacterium]